MTKRILAIAMAAMLVILGSISAFAATEPTVTCFFAVALIIRRLA